MNTRPEEAVEIGGRLRDAREQCQMTQQDAARTIGVHRTALMAWEQGRSQPRASELRGLVQLYGASAHRVLFGYDLIELDKDDAQEMERAARDLSPALRLKVLLLVRVLGRLGAIRSK